MWRAVREVAPSVGDDVCFIVHQVPQPWHAQGSHVHEAALAVKRVVPEMYPAYVDAVFAAFDVGRFADRDTWEKSRAQVRARRQRRQLRRRRMLLTPILSRGVGSGLKCRFDARLAAGDLGQRHALAGGLPSIRRGAWSHVAHAAALCGQSCVSHALPSCPPTLLPSYPPTSYPPASAIGKPSKQLARTQAGPRSEGGINATRCGPRRVSLSTKAITKEPAAGDAHLPPRSSRELFRVSLM